MRTLAKALPTAKKEYILYIVSPIDIQSVKEVLNSVGHSFGAVYPRHLEDSRGHSWHGVQMASSDHIQGVGEELQLLLAAFLVPIKHQHLPAKIPCC